MKWLLLLLVILPICAWGQIITTIAGDGTPASTGDNNQALLSQLNRPSGIAFDKYGNLYVTEIFGHKIRKIDTLGIISTIAGIGIAGFSGDSGLATNAKLYNPKGIKIDTLGNIFFADEGNNRIRKINTSGVITTVIGNGATGYNGDGILAVNSSIFQPNNLFFDTTGILCITDGANYRIRTLSTTGIISTIAGTGVAGCLSAQASLSTFSGPNSIYIDAIGNIYITDEGSSTIRKIDTAMNMTTIAGICSGMGGYNGDNIPAINAKVYAPWDIKMDKNGNLFIADKNNYRIRKIDTAGIITTVVGTGIGGFSGDSGLATAAKINLPYGLVFDACGNLLFTDGWNNRIRKVWFNTDTLPHAAVGITPNDTVNTSTQVTTTASVNTGTIIASQWVKNGVTTGTTTSSYTYTPTNGDSIYCIVTTRACTGRTYTDTTQVLHITVTGDAGITKATNHTTHTYPNPVRDMLYISTTEAQSYVLHNLMGVTIQQGTVSKNNSIDMRAIPAGIYLLQLTDNNGERVVQRIVKE